MKTITEVIQVSRRLVQLILRASALTSRKNCNGETRFFGGSVAVATERPPLGSAGVKP
jgi:hypothetical protein